MIVEIKIPSPGESITEVEIANWLVQNGDYVTKDQELAEVESDKATLPLLASESGKISILQESGTTIRVGQTACTIDTSAEAPKLKESASPAKTKKEAPVKVTLQEEKPEKKIIEEAVSDQPEPKITPLAKKIMEDKNISASDVIQGLKKITTREVQQVIGMQQIQNSALASVTRNVEKQRMSSLRRKISERLVTAKNQTAMLTTFNEVDMSALLEIRTKNQAKFHEKYGVKLGFMSFFSKAATLALHKYPGLNSYIEEDQICTPTYSDIAIAVQTEKGLMAPVLRNCETLSIPQLETQIAELAAKARNFKLTPEELSGGTFTITNGGIFGSLLSTPLINPPQSGILGLHKIQDRPIALNGQVVIRPMMYIALSYDHRIIDGKDSVSFLATIKSLIESPVKLLTEDKDIDSLLLGI